MYDSHFLFLYLFLLSEFFFINVLTTFKMSKMVNHLFLENFVADCLILGVEMGLGRRRISRDQNHLLKLVLLYIMILYII